MNAKSFGAGNVGVALTVMSAESLCNGGGAVLVRV